MKPYYEDDQGVTLYHGDNRDVLKTLPDASIDSIVTDPPYELGFMGRAWDSSGIAYDVDLWRECFRVLKPGGHLLSFGASRTFHRMAVAVEDAGFELRDSIAWLYGSGFPKSMDVAKAIDKLDASDERRARAVEFTAWMRSTGITAKLIDGLTDSFMGGHYLTDRVQAAIPTPDMFDLLRPHLPEVPERIEDLVRDRVVESENFAKRPSAEYASSVGMADSWTDGKGWSGKAARGGSAITSDAAQWEGWGTALKPAFEPIVVGRKPFAGTVAANVLAHGTGALNIDGTRVGSDIRVNPAAGNKPGGASLNMSVVGMPADAEAREAAGRWPTNVVLDESQAAVLDAQTGILTSGKLAPHHADNGKAAGTLGAFAGATGRESYGDSGGASQFFPTFRYEAKAPGSERPDVDGVQHATVKPLELMRWLVRLVTPPGGTVLEPFAGSGTTIEAALLEGFRCIAVEIEADHMPLIMKRVRKPLQQSLFGDWDGAA